MCIIEEKRATHTSTAILPLPNVMKTNNKAFFYKYYLKDGMYTLHTPMVRMWWYASVNVACISGILYLFSSHMNISGYIYVTQTIKIFYWDYHKHFVWVSVWTSFGFFPLFFLFISKIFHKHFAVHVTYVLCSTFTYVWKVRQRHCLKCIMCVFLITNWVISYFYDLLFI